MVCEGAVSHFFSHAKHPRWFNWSSSHLAVRNFPCHILSLTSVLPPLQCRLLEVAFDLTSAPSVLSRLMRSGKLRLRVIPSSSANVVAPFDERPMTLMCRIRFKRPHQAHGGVLITIQLNGCLDLSHFVLFFY